MSERRQIQYTAGERSMPNSPRLTMREFDRLPEQAGSPAVTQQKFAASQISRLSSDDVLILQRTLGNRAVQRLFLSQTDPHSTPLPVQARLTVGPVDDPYEREADHIAAQVVSLINAPKQTASDVGDSPRHLQRVEDDEDLKRTPLVKSIDQPGRQRGGELERKPLMRFAATELDGLEVSPDVESSIQAARGSGQPLTENLRASMENAFGVDFSRVRTHTGAEADRLNRSIQARAFTTGQDIFFREGEYNPASKEGQFLIAHELSHVMQQNQAAKKNDANVINQFAVRRPPSDLQRLIKINGKEEDKVPDDILRLIQCLEGQSTYAKGTANILKGITEESRSNDIEYKSWLDAADDISIVISGQLDQDKPSVLPSVGQIGAHTTTSTTHTTSSQEAPAPMDISSTHTTSSQQAPTPMDMDTSSESGQVSSENLGTGKAIPSLEFGQKLKKNTRALGIVSFVMSNLGDKAKEFYQFVEKDPLTSIEFEIGKVKNAAGETFLFADIDGWVNLEDSDAPVFTNWYKINQNTRLKIRMILKQVEPGADIRVYLRAVHELTVHGIFYRKFIELIRGTANRSGEVAVYFFSQINDRGELNAYNQHFMHGNSPDTQISEKRTRGAKKYSGPGSGIPAYNETISNLYNALLKSNPDLANKLMDEASIEVMRHRGQIRTQVPIGKKTTHQKQDADNFKRIPPREGSFSELFTLLTRRKPDAEDPKLDPLLKSLTPAWIEVLLIYFDYKKSIDEGFDINRSVVAALPATGDGKALLSWTKEPLAETLLEAIAEYLVYRLSADDIALTGESEFVTNLLFDVSNEEWEVIKRYIIFRCLYYFVTGDRAKAERWLKTSRDIPLLLEVLNNARTAHR